MLLIKNSKILTLLNLLLASLLYFYSVFHIHFCTFLGEGLSVPTHLLKMVLGHTEAMDTYGVYGHEFAGDLQNVANATQNMFNQILGN